MAGSTLHRIVIIAVCLVLMVFLHLVVAICVMLFRARPSRRVGEHAGEERGGGAGLAAEEVGQLPCHEFKEGAGGGGGGECAVCLDVFRSGDRCRLLPRCGHRFHADCLDSWLRKSRQCPVCRTEAVEQQKDATGAGAVAATVEIVTQG